MYDKIASLANEAKYWEFRSETTTSNSISGWNGHPRQIAKTSKQGYCFRVLYGNGWGFSSSFNNDFKSLVNSAIKIAKIMDHHSKDKKQVFEAKAIKDIKATSFKINPEDISLEEKKNKIISLTKLGEKGIVSKEISYNDSMRKKHFINSEGSDIKQNLLYSHYSVNSTAKSATKIESFYQSAGGQIGFEVTNNMQENSMIASKKALQMLDAKVPKSGNYPLIADGILTDVFIHEALGHAAEADNMLYGGTCLDGLQGKKLGHENINVYDDSSIPQLWGSFFYDEEGTKANKTQIIKNGILHSSLHSRETAALCNAKPTGNARAQDYNFKPIVRMSNTYIEKGDAKFEEMLTEMKNGIYLKGSKGGVVDPLKGSFTFSAQEGYVVKKGELTQHLRGVSLGGMTLEILKGIQMISNKYEKGFPGTCGKNGQGVPVIGLCPSILIDKAHVGGK